MSLHQQNHHALLQYRVKTSGSAPMFKIPEISGSTPLKSWSTISFLDFSNHVDVTARCIAANMKSKDVPDQAIVGVWFSGMEYHHWVYTIALSRAGFIPQMFGGSLTSFGIIFELMSKAGAKAIFYEPSFESEMTDCPFPHFPALSVNDIPRGNGSSQLGAIEDLPSGDEACFIFHTSGSTSGSPKLVPYTHKWVSALYPKFEQIWTRLSKPVETQDIFVQQGSICHASSFLQYLRTILMGSCIVHPSTPRFSIDELESMVRICGLNRLYRFSPFLSAHIKAAKTNPSMLKLLQNMRSVTYGGVPVSADDDKWCYENSIPLTNTFGCTECGTIMTSTLGKPSRFLRPLPSVSCRFEPASGITQSGDSTSNELFELVILADSPDMPQPHLRSPDGNFHTGDLFEKQSDGSFVSRGRDDDWIKDETAKRCDTKAIEDKVHETCGEIVKDCIVVGNGRPSPTLFVELVNSQAGEPNDRLKEIIVDRLRDFNKRRYFHERITNKKLVYIVEDGTTLPRTVKGNIRRKMIEEKYATELDEMYASV